MNDGAAILERFQVHELIGRYVDALNHRDWARYKDCWVENSLFTMTISNDDAPAQDKLTSIKKPTGVRVVGRDQILSMVGTYNNYPWLFQIPTGIVVELNGPATAQIRHTLHVFSQSLNLIGLCYDRAVKEGDGLWRLAHRDYRPSYWEYWDAPGQTCRKLPDLNYRNLP
jgi:SnoaL-like domain